MIGALHIYGYNTSDGDTLCRKCATDKYGDPPYERNCWGKTALPVLHDYNTAEPEHYDDLCDNCGEVVIEAYHSEDCCGCAAEHDEHTGDPVPTTCQLCRALEEVE